MLLLPLLLLGLSFTTASPTPPSQAAADAHYLTKRLASNCTTANTRIRKEWRSLTSAEQKSYLDAEVCLMNLPSKTGLPGVQSRFEDLQAMHQIQTDIIHGVAQFLPFHRLYIHTHETLLQTECNYTGTQPWWDETLDSGKFLSSPLLTAGAFGGDGDANNDYCITSGPFKDITLNIGPGQSTTTPHCLSRKVNEQMSLLARQTVVDACNAYDNFLEMWKCNIQRPHGAGHGGVGKVCQDPDTSPGDPLFYMHHNWLDRVWWQWQSADLENRLYQLGGYTTKTEPAGGWVETTLDYVMELYGIVPDATVGDVMDIQGGYLCYDWEY